MTKNTFVAKVTFKCFGHLINDYRHFTPSQDKTDDFFTEKTLFMGHLRSFLPSRGFSEKIEVRHAQSLIDI